MSKVLIASRGRTIIARFASLMVGLSIATSAHATGPLVAIDTSLGRIVVELDTERAPQTSYNFLRYVADRHYDGTLFHRVMEGFVVQGGGLIPNMDEKPTHEPIVNEANNGLSNVTGTIAMAREEAVNSATSQFFINVVDNLRLDHVNVPPEGVTLVRRGKEVFYSRADADKVYGYAVFGYVVQGQAVIERMRHVAVTTVVHGKETYENVPVEPVVILKAVLLPPTN